jgi:dolichyl-phosphate-mannose-protein mannosyltransferase
MKITEEFQFSSILKYTGLLVFGYLLLLSLSYGTSAYQPIMTLLVGLLVWFSANNIVAFHNRHGGTKTLLGILLIGGIIRFSWAVFVPTLPVSDFQIFHENAIKLSQGTAITTKYMGYNLLLSLGYRIYPDVLTGKIINAIASTLSISFIYLVGSKLINQQIGLIAAFLFTILPSEINMVSVLGTEVVATTIGLITAFFLVHVTNSNLNISTIRTFCAGIVYGLGLTFRSSLIFYFPAIVLFVFFLFPNIKQKLKVLGIFLVGLATGLGLMIMSYSLIAGYVSSEPLKTQDTIIGFLTGTNIESTGQWNLEDNDLYYSWPANGRNERVIRESLKRITAKPVEFLLLIPKKFSILMASNDYGNAWSLYAIDWGEGNFLGVHAEGKNNWEKYRNFESALIKINGMLSQAVYIIIWLFAFCTFMNLKNGSTYGQISLIVLTLVLFTLLPHIVLEVQSRYHHTIMPFIALLTACGIQQYKNTC